MRRINVNLYPKDGHWFLERDGARIRSTTWGGVIARVRAYRVRNKMPVGDPDAEVHEQACQRNANLCSTVDDATIHARRVVSMKGKMLGWLNALRKTQEQTPSTFVDPTEAHRRADICAQCPQNAHLSSGCGSCKAALAEMRRAVIGSHRSVDHRLGGCLLTGEDLPASVHIDQTRLDLPAAPQACWRKRTL